MSERCLIYAPQEDMAGVCANCGKNRYAHDDGAKAEPAPPAPPAAPDLADYQEWWSRQIPNNFKHESAVAIAYAQSKLARAEPELEKLREALRKLKNEAHGFLSMADVDTHGATNMRVLRLRIAEAESALSEKGSK